MTIALELIPRDKQSLVLSLKQALKFPEITLINVPDLKKFFLRSWEACAIIAETQPINTMPHIRAIDFDLQQSFSLCEPLRGINRVLVIAGDPPAEGSAFKTYPTETTAFIRRLKTEMPGLKIYAAFDPYRTNIRYELDYLKAKEDAGAEGFMSQPFFDLRLLEIYAEYLEGKDVFWGISPVLSESSRNYWESRNRAIFPRSFTPSLNWNVDFGRNVLGFCKKQGFSVYLMPIMVNINSYLAALFAP